MSEFDSKSANEMLDLICEVVISIDGDLEILKNENAENKISRITGFLVVMKYITDEQIDIFQNLFLDGDKETMQGVMHWCLSRHEHLKKRAYLAKYLMPVEIPPEFMSEDLVSELSQRLKDMQNEFKIVHKNADKMKSSGMKPQEYKNEISQLEQERSQLSQKIQRLQKESAEGDEQYFKDMLKVTSNLRKEQEEEAKINDRLREVRTALHTADSQLNEATKRLGETRKQGVQSQSAEQLLAKLQNEVKDLNDRKRNLDDQVNERLRYLDKLQGFENDRTTTEEDVRDKRMQLRDIEEDIRAVQDNLDVALERNDNLAICRQASNMAYSKLREKETEYEKLQEEKRKLLKQTEEKEAEMDAKARASGGRVKKDIKKYGAQVREKIESYKKMRDEISSLRNELVILQRTEQILKSRDKNLDDFLTELERKKGVEGVRETQRQLAEMSEKTAEVDQLKGATLEEISAMVEQIGREFKNKQIQLQPMMTELKSLRQEYMEVETKHAECKSTYDKVAIGLEMDKQALERECDAFQEECLREESRYHTLNCLVSMSRIRLQRAEQEKKWNEGHGRMLRDFASFKELYNHKIAQQEQLTKQLRVKQKELKENAMSMTRQKQNFLSLQKLLQAKMNSQRGEQESSYMGSANVMSMDN